MSTRDDPTPGAGLLPVLLTAGVLSGWTLVLADSCVRTGFRYFPLAKHFAAAFALYAAVGALLGVLAWLLIRLEWWVLGRRLEAGGKHRLRPLAYGLLAALGSSSTARWAFRGARIARSSAASWGPPLFAALIGLGTGCGVWVVLEAERARRTGLRRRFGWFASGVGCAGLGLVYADLRFYVALYPRIHTLLELAAALALGGGYALGLARACQSSRPMSGALRRFAWLMGAWLLVGVGSSRVRAWLDGALAPVWLDEVYIGRELRRVQIAEAFFKAPLHWPGLALSRVDRLRERYPLGDTTLDPRWQEPLTAPALLDERIRALRGEHRPLNLVVFYVDTLRQDIARDAHTLPALARFERQALVFERAYAAGSDTLRSLPAITGGNYDVSTTPPNDLLRVAKRAGYRSELVIPDSAQGFLGKLRPDFRFDHTTRVLDHQAGLEVWGYGANQPTAARLVGEGIHFLDAARADNRPFLLWLFNFDQHNWHELDDEYVARKAAAHGIDLGAEGATGRYRAVAAGIDDAFGSLLNELDRRGLASNTIVLFVSDHGEALGRNGFWMHSVFLWDELVRVPLALRVPGLPPAQVANPVSLVDLAPTLARYLQPAPALDGYQGEDLLAYLAEPAHARRLPILLTAASKDLLVRVGVLDAERPYKLVVPFEAALPELFDLASPHGELVNAADQHPHETVELLHALARSPVFPRSADDFDVRETKAQKALPHAPEPD